MPDFILNGVEVVSKCCEHLCGTQVIAGVCELLFVSYFENAINHGGHIILAHLVKTVVIELPGVALWTNSGMVATVNIATIVSNPNIPIVLEQLDGKGVEAIHDPIVGTLEQSMLQ